MWSVPRCISTQKVNSYTLETLTGAPLNGIYHACRLHAFQPWEGTKLALLEAAQCNTKGDTDKVEEREGVDDQMGEVLG